MTRTDIIKSEPSRALIKEFIRRWGVGAGTARAAKALGTSVSAVNEARRFF